MTGAASGGTVITVVGTNLTAGLKIDFGGSECGSVQIVSDTQARCTTTRHNIGKVTVTATSTDGEIADLANAYSFLCQDKPYGMQIWANNGEDKVTRDDLRATCDPVGLKNSVWDGTTVKLFAAKNEVVAFNLILEASGRDSKTVAVSFNNLSGPGSQISSVAADGEGVFNFTQRNIEMFYVRYLQVKGVSLTAYGTYDERHTPLRMRRPWSGNGVGTGGWADRPDHDKFYPEIAVPLELEPTFDIATDQNQSIFTDIYVPKSSNAGVYNGTITITENGSTVKQIPVELTVRNFTLPDVPTAKSMVYLGYADIGQRYTGVTYPNTGTPQNDILNRVRDRHFLLAHRHKISLVDSNPGAGIYTADAPRPEWIPRLNGSLFTSANGYAGPGAGVGNNIYSIGMYGSWSWKTGNQTDMQTHSDAWETWFQTNASSTERSLYLQDGTVDYAQVEQWAQWLNGNSGPGGNLSSMATGNFLKLNSECPSLNIRADQLAVGDTATYDAAVASIKSNAKNRLIFENSIRPASGSFATEDDGVALRELAWGQYKKKIDRWFYWESTYYNDYQNARGQTDVFHNANTYGKATTVDPVFGEYDAYRHSNGHGVLFYPGTDTVFPGSSYGLEGPMVSLRLKHWRRGIQDVDYIALANAVNPTKTQAIVNAMVPKVMWENGVDNPASPSYKSTDISWSTNPDDWESARAQLADIIEGH